LDWNWNYHNYRDSDIATYVKAAEWLAAIKAYGCCAWAKL
jgi:hypothetical protein